MFNFNVCPPQKTNKQHNDFHFFLFVTLENWQKKMHRYTVYSVYILPEHNIVTFYVHVDKSNKNSRILY